MLVVEEHTSLFYPNTPHNNMINNVLIVIRLRHIGCRGICRASQSSSHLFMSTVE